MAMTTRKTTRGYWLDSRLMASRTTDSESPAGAPIRNSPDCRVDKKLYFPDPLIEFIEGSDAALEQRSSILRGLDAVRAAVEQRYTERMLCVGKRS